MDLETLSSAIEVAFELAETLGGRDSKGVELCPKESEPCSQQDWSTATAAASCEAVPRQWHDW